jgi:head-tail adaptor
MQRRYDRVITIQRGTPSLSSSGEETMTWADIAFRVPAHVAPTRGTESAAPSQEVAQQQVTITTRFHNVSAASRPLTARDRIIYPAEGVAANTQAPPAGSVYDIVSPDEVGRQVDWSIKCTRRADT